MRDKIARFNRSIERKSGETGEAFDRRYIQGQGSLSREIDEKYRGAFLKLNQRLAKIWECLREDLDMEEGVLPIRPLILAGDDICYVTDGRIALETARIFWIYSAGERAGAAAERLRGSCGGESTFSFFQGLSAGRGIVQKCQESDSGRNRRFLAGLACGSGRIAGQPAGGQEQYTAEDGSVLTQKPYSVEASSPGGTIQNFFACAGSAGGQNGCQIQGAGPAGSHASGKGCRPICSAVQPDAGSDSETGMV